MIEKNKYLIVGFVLLMICSFVGGVIKNNVFLLFVSAFCFLLGSVIYSIEYRGVEDDSY